MNYDIAIIGAGAAGIACAKIAARNSLTTVLIENSLEDFGGTCLNRGCIPAKFFLNSSKTNKDWNAVLKEKEILIKNIKLPLLEYLKKTALEVIFSHASFLNNNSLQLEGKIIQARHIIIAAGSRPQKILEDKRCVFSEELFSESNIPKRFLIVGAGYIGIEAASLLNSFGKEVIVIEKENRILPSFEENLSGRLRAILEQKNIKIDTAVDTGKYNTSVFDKIILATGRTPNSQGLNLEKAGVICDEKGWIKTDSFMRTNVKNIYACGDITAKKLLAYIAEYQARLCIDNILGKKQKEDYSVLPECVFCLPQIAKVGIGENEAKEKNLKHKIIRSNFLKFSSAHVYDDKQGFIQLIVDQKDIIIGAAIISNFAAELINLLALMIRQKVTLSSFKHCHFIHPTLSEMIPLLLKDIC